MRRPGINRYHWPQHIKEFAELSPRSRRLHPLFQNIHHRHRVFKLATAVLAPSSAFGRLRNWLLL